MNDAARELMKKQHKMIGQLKKEVWLYKCMLLFSWGVFLSGLFCSIPFP